MPASISEIEGSTTNIDQFARLNAALKRQEERYCLIFNYADRDMTNVFQPATALWCSNIIAKICNPLITGKSSAITSTTTNEYSAIISSLDNWLCDSGDILNNPFASTQILTCIYYLNDSAATWSRLLSETRSPLDNSMEILWRNLLNSLNNDDIQADLAFYLTEGIDNLVAKYGKAILSVIEKKIDRREMNDAIASETLQALGRIEDDITKMNRFDLLARALKNKIPLIRDGAVIGLAFLDDKKAIPILKSMLGIEPIPTLKENIRIAIEDFESA